MAKLQKLLKFMSNFYMSPYSSTFVAAPFPMLRFTKYFKVSICNSLSTKVLLSSELHIFVSILGYRIVWTGKGAPEFNMPIKTKERPKRYAQFKRACVENSFLKLTLKLSRKVVKKCETRTLIA